MSLGGQAQSDGGNLPTRTSWTGKRSERKWTTTRRVKTAKSADSIGYKEINSKGYFSKGKPFGNRDEATINIASADLNQDGHIDLVLANRNSQPNKIYFGPNFEQSFLFGEDNNETRGVAIEDMNQDGFLDIITVNIGNKNGIYFGDGSGKYARSIFFGKTSDATMAVVIGDLDNDGDLDIVAGNNNQKNQYFINNGDEFSPFQFGESSSISYGVTLGDFSGNGKLDIIVSNSGSRNIVYYNQSKWSYC